MNKLFAIVIAGCLALLGFVVVRAIMTVRDTEVKVADQSPNGRLKRRIGGGKNIDEIRKIAKDEAHKLVERERKQQKDAKCNELEQKKKMLAALMKSLEDEQKQLSAEEKAMLDELNEAMCGDDFELVSFAATDLANNPNPLVRRAAVEAISWFGDRGLPELAVYLVDANEEVSSLAKERWSLGVQEIEDDQEKVTMSKLGLLYVKDEDSLTSFMGDLTTATDDLIVMQALVDLIEEGTPESAAVAKEQYEWMTGDEWTNFDAAEAWMQENYEPPDPG